MPLNAKASKVLRSMIDRYGSKKGERIFYATANKRKLTPETWEKKEAMSKTAAQHQDRTDDGVGGSTVPRRKANPDRPLLPKVDVPDSRDGRLGRKMFGDRNMPRYRTLLQHERKKQPSWAARLFDRVRDAVQGGPEPKEETGMWDQIKDYAGKAWDATKDWAGKPGYTGLGMNRGTELGVGLGGAAILAWLLSRRRRPSAEA